MKKTFYSAKNKKTNELIRVFTTNDDYVTNIYIFTEHYHGFYWLVESKEIAMNFFERHENPYLSYLETPIHLKDTILEDYEIVEVNIEW
jgi:hypothetical protein